MSDATQDDIEVFEFDFMNNDVSPQGSFVLRSGECKRRAWQLFGNAEANCTGTFDALGEQSDPI